MAGLTVQGEHPVSQQMSGPAMPEGRRHLGKDGEPMGMRLIAAAEADDYIAKGTYTLIDLRAPAAYRKGHLKGAYNVPYEVFLQMEERLDKNQKYIFYCDWGGSSLDVCRRLGRRGYQVISMLGGMAAYRGRYLVR